MKQIILTAELFSSIILAIIFYASIMESSMQGRKDRVFSVFVGLNLFLMASDAISLLTDGHTETVLISKVCSYISVNGCYILTIAFGEYLRLQLKEKGGDVELLQKINLIYGSAAFIISTVASIKGLLFRFDNGVYTEGEYYIYYLYSMVPMYALQFIMLFKNIKKIPRHDAMAFLCYAMMPILMTGIDMLLPGLALSLPSMSVSVLLLYVTLQSGRNRAAAVREAALREKSYTDDLTGALNRRAFSERCDKLKEDDKLHIAFCDVNGLKYINDTQGHAEGDRMLRSISENFRNIFGNDNFYRISGDEFVVMEINTDSGSFKEKLRHLREITQKEDYEPVAIGTAEGRGRAYASLMTNAEEEMYVAKALFHRRNPRFVRGGGLFVRDIADDSNHTETMPDSVLQTEEERKYTGKHSKILLLESSNDETRLLRGLLSENYEIVSANNIQQALELLQAKPLNISTILMDVHLPEISGYEFLSEVMKDTQLSTIPVIITGSGMKRSEETNYLRMGAYDCIHKPYSPDMLLNRIKRAVQLKESLNVLADVEFDELTGVYNRQAFFHYMRDSLEDGSNTAYDLTILDIPDFKAVNKRFNIEKGDEVLKFIAAQIRETMRGREGQYGRYDADMFMLLTPHGSFDEAAREALAEKIEKNANVEGIVVKYGVYENLPHNVAPSVLYDLTMTALRSIKHTYGIRTGLYDEKIQQSIDLARRLETDMETAVREEQFEVYYQPKHDARTGRLAGAEALVRWKHPHLGMLMPKDFIPQFERNGFINSVDRYIWQRTCRNLKRWQKEGLNPVPVSVNASRRDFNDPELFEQADEERVSLGVPADLLHLEVTESTLGERSEVIKQILEKCRERGYLVELDDFGTGYSSLGELGNLPVDIVKFDRVFVVNAANPRGASVLNAGILVARKLGMKILAEGVETEEQLSLIRDAECDYIQGFYFARPMSEKDFGEYLKKNAER